MSLMPDIDRLLAADETNVTEMRRVFAGFQGLSELLNEASVLYTTCTRALSQELYGDVHNLQNDPRQDAAVMAVLVSDRCRSLLFARVGVLYAAAVADLLRMRLTTPMGYLRLQCESIALLKLMKENPAITKQWMEIREDADGRRFFNKYQPRIRDILKAYELSDTYEHASSDAMHSRFIALAQGYRTRSFEDGTRVIQEDRINLQEFDPENPQHFMIGVVHDAVPEINDPLLLETRFPQFGERVNRMMNHARERFAPYFPSLRDQSEGGSC
jgi:hypothetical protein